MPKCLKSLSKIVIEFQPSNLGFRTPVVFINLYCFWFLMEAFCLKRYFTPFDKQTKFVKLEFEDLPQKLSYF